MDDLDLVIDLHLRNDRQGPGSEDETLRALALTRIDPTRPLEVADLGCGTGASTLALARALPHARVHAIDATPSFIDRLRARAEEAGVGDRITACARDMRTPDIPRGSLDLVWSESAVYSIGFETGVRAWRGLLRPMGALALSELVWTTPSRPPEVEAHRLNEYPSITSVDANMRTLEDAGYRVLGFFMLPPSAWREAYYAPLRAGFDAFLQRHERSPRARRVIATEEREMALFETHGAWYAYAFFIAQRFEVRRDPHIPSRDP